MRKIIVLFLIVSLFPGAIFSQTAGADKKEGVRLKDLARITSARTNRLIGYGIVAGLPGSGDSRSLLATKTLKNLLQNMGLSVEDLSSEHRNIAAVLVTAELPPYAKRGDRIGVHVSSIGDARSLEGGILMETELQGQNRQVYAVAQGILASGDQVSGRQNKNPRTTVPVPGGALVERETLDSEDGGRTLRISLNQFDFTTLSRIQELLKKEKPDWNSRIEGGSVLLDSPADKNIVETAAYLEDLRLVPDFPARVVINERTGTIVMGGDIRIDPVAIAKSGLGESNRSSSPNPATMGIYLPPLDQKENSAPKAMHAIQATSVEEFVEAINKTGATPREMISILQALRDSGALHAELVIL